MFNNRKDIKSTRFRELDPLLHKGHQINRPKLCFRGPLSRVLSDYRAMWPTVSMLLFYSNSFYCHTVLIPRKGRVGYVRLFPSSSTVKTLWNEKKISGIDLVRVEGFVFLFKCTYLFSVYSPTRVSSYLFLSLYSFPIYLFVAVIKI